MKRILYTLAFAFLPAAASAGQIGLTCTGASLCIQGKGCGANSDEITVFIGALGNPDKALVHIGHESVDADRTDNHLAFTFRSGAARFALQVFDENRQFALMGVGDDGQVNTYSGSCEAIQ